MRRLYSEKFQLNSGYQTYEFAWSAQGQYVYRTRDYHSLTEGEGPRLGFIARDAAGKLLFDRPPTNNRWSVHPTWLTDGRLAWIDAAPGYPISGNEYAFQMQAVMIAGKPVLEKNLMVEWPAWAPDGTALAYPARTRGANTPPDTIRWLTW